VVDRPASGVLEQRFCAVCNYECWMQHGVVADTLRGILLRSCGAEELDLIQQSLPPRAAPYDTEDWELARAVEAWRCAARDGLIHDKGWCITVDEAASFWM
jgi:hypothetical protein